MSKLKEALASQEEVLEALHHEKMMVLLYTQLRLFGFTAAHLWKTEYGAVIRTPKGTIGWCEIDNTYELRRRDWPFVAHKYSATDPVALAALCVNAGIAELP